MFPDGGVLARAEREGRFRRSGQTTQLVVGASDETDRQIARAADWLYRILCRATEKGECFGTHPFT